METVRYGGREGGREAALSGEGSGARGSYWKIRPTDRGRTAISSSFPAMRAEYAALGETRDEREEGEREGE